MIYCGLKEFLVILRRSEANRTPALIVKYDTGSAKVLLNEQVIY